MFPAISILLGSLLILTGIFLGGWSNLISWLGFDFILLGLAQGFQAPGMLGKRSDGSLLLWSWILYLPLHLFTFAVWHLARIISREDVYNIVSDDLVIGRRLLPHELTLEIANYVDLTSELPEPTKLRHLDGYKLLPILDGCAPRPDEIREIISGLRPGRTYVHCAQGHGRTALFTIAILLHSGRVKTVEEGIALVKSVRPGIHLSQSQFTMLKAYASGLL